MRSVVPTLFTMPRTADSPPHQVDATDRALLTLLQADARASTASLARKLGVARTTVVARLARLESSGVVAGYTVRLGGPALGSMVQAFVGVGVSPKAGRAVVQRIGRMPEVRQLASVSGELDYVVVLEAATTERLDALLDEIGEIDGVTQTRSSIVLAMRIDRRG